MNFDGIPFGGNVSGTGSGNIVQSDGVAVTADTIPRYANGSGLLISSSGLRMSDKLNVSGTLPMTGGLDLGGNEVKNTGVVRPRDDTTSDIGTSAKRFKDAFVAGNLIGPTYSRSVDNIVSNFGASTVGNVAIYNSTTGKEITDGSVLLTSLATTASQANNVNNTGTSVSGNLPTFSGTTGKLIADSTVALSSLATTASQANNVTNAGTSASGNLPTFSGTTGKLIADSTVALSSLATTASQANNVTNAGTSVSGNLPTFSGTTGKLIADSTVALSSLATNTGVSSTYLAKGGGTMTGGIVMGANAVTGTGANSAGSYSAATSITTPLYNATLSDTDKFLMLGTANGSKLAHSSGWSVDSYAGAFTSAAGSANSGAYRWRAVDGTGLAWKDLAALSNVGNFSAIGSISTSNTTDSTTISSGSITTLGGIGVAKKMNIGLGLNCGGAGDPTAGLGINLAFFGPTTAATAANAYSIGVNKTGTDAIGMGINKNSATGAVPSNAAFISTYQSNSVLAIGRGNGAGVPSAADILVNSDGSVTLGNTSDSTATSNGSLILPGGVGIAKKAFIGSNTVIGPTQTINMETCLTLRGANNSGGTGPHITQYAGDQWPVFELMGLTHNNIQMLFDCYTLSNNFLTSSSATSNFRIGKINDALTFEVTSGITVGSTISSMISAATINNIGNFTFVKPMLMVSTTTPAIFGSGGCLYVESGALKFRGSGGTITTIAPA